MFSRLGISWLFMLVVLGSKRICLKSAVRLRRDRKTAAMFNKSFMSKASSRTSSKLGVSQIFNRLEELIAEYNNETQEQEGRRPKTSKAAPPAQDNSGFLGFSLSIPGCGGNCVMGLTNDDDPLEIVGQVTKYQAATKVQEARRDAAMARQDAANSELEAKRLEQYAASQGVQIKVTNGVVKGAVDTPLIAVFQNEMQPQLSGRAPSRSLSRSDSRSEVMERPRNSKTAAEEAKFALQPAPGWMNTLLENFWPNVKTSIREMTNQMLATTAMDIVNNIKDNQMVDRLYYDFLDIGGRIQINEMGYIQSRGPEAGKLGERKYWQGFQMGIEATQGLIKHPDADGYLNLFGGKQPERLFAFIRIRVKLKKTPVPLTVDVRVKTITGVVNVMLGPTNGGGMLPFKGLSVGFESMPDLGISIYVHMFGWIPGGTSYLDSFIMSKVLNALNKNIVLPSRQFVPLQPDLRTDDFPSGVNDQYFEWRNGNSKPAYLVIAKLVSEVDQNMLSAYKVWASVTVKGEKHDSPMQNLVPYEAPYIVIPEDGDMIPIAMSISSHVPWVHSYELARIEARAKDAAEATQKDPDGAKSIHRPVGTSGVKLTAWLKKVPVRELKHVDVNRERRINIYRVEIHSIKGVTTIVKKLGQQMRGDNDTAIGEKEENDPISAYYKVQVCMQAGSREECKDTEKGADANPFVAGSVENLHAVDFSTLTPFPRHPTFTVQLFKEIPDNPRDFLCPKLDKIMLFNAVRINPARGESMQRVTFDVPPVPPSKSFDRSTGQREYESVSLTWRMKWFGPP